MDESNARIKLIHESDKIYYWSIRHRKLMELSEEYFQNGNIYQCQLCIPNYNATDFIKNQKQCELKFNCLSKTKSHFFSCERYWRRHLVWSTESEIPSQLDRPREIGDLMTLLDKPYLKIKFDTITLCDNLQAIKRYFQLNGCPCKDGFNLKCENQALKNSTNHLFSHLAAIERKTHEYIVFGSDSNNFDESETEKKENSYSNISSNACSNSCSNAESIRKSNHVYIPSGLLNQVFSSFPFLKKNNYSIALMNFESEQNTTSDSIPKEETVNSNQVLNESNLLENEIGGK